MAQTQAPAAGVSLGSLLVAGLTILFVYLKLTEQIDWSWWWVVSPIWISFAFGVLVALVGLVIFGCIVGADKLRSRKARKDFEALLAKRRLRR